MMSWITGIQKAIDYIEMHLTDEIDFEAAAREAYSSSLHFQRVFSAKSGGLTFNSWHDKMKKMPRKGG